MFCPKCGASLPDGSQFCGKCGNKIEGAAKPAPVQQPVARHASGAKYSAGHAATSVKAPAASLGSLNIRNIIAAIGAILVVAGFMQPWVKMTSLATSGSSVANTLTSLIGKSSYTFQSSYDLFSFTSLGQGFDYYLSSSDYSMLFGAMFAGAALAAALVIIGAILLLVSKKTALIRVAGILSVIVSVVVMGLLTYMTGNDWNSFFTVEMTGCILAVIGGLLAIILPQRA